MGDVDFTWRRPQQMAYNVENIKAGQTTQIPAREALRMELVGNGTRGKVLKPHQHDQQAFDKFMKEERAKWDADHPECQPIPGSGPIGRHPAYPPHSFSRQGWGA